LGHGGLTNESVERSFHAGGAIMETGDFIERLARDATPVRPLPSPMTRAVLWVAISLPYVAGIALAYRLAGNEISLSLDTRYLIQQLATIATAVTAAVAAFCCVVPGRDRRIALLPLLPLAVWLATLAEEWTAVWLQSGVAGLGLRIGWDCVPVSALLALAPAIAIALMLRRGAPLFPHSTLALGALAAAGLGNLGLRLFNIDDISAMTLVWHLGASALLFGLAWWAGPLVLSWSHEPLR
jgi:hypothetical protein